MGDLKKKKSCEDNEMIENEDLSLTKGEELIIEKLRGYIQQFYELQEKKMEQAEQEERRNSNEMEAK